MLRAIARPRAPHTLAGSAAIARCCAEFSADLVHVPMHANCQWLAPVWRRPIQHCHSSNDPVQVAELQRFIPRLALVGAGRSAPWPNVMEAGTLEDCLLLS